MNLPEGLPAWAYVVVSALVLAAQIVTAIWVNHQGDLRGAATRAEITNNHDKPLRDDLDEKNQRIIDAIEGLRDDVNGEFATVNRRITASENNVIELRQEVHDLRRNNQQPQ